MASPIIWTYVIGAIGIILLPGPNSLYVLSVATARGVQRRLPAAHCGVFLGDTRVLMLVRHWVLASLLRSNPGFVPGGEVRRGRCTWPGWGCNLVWAAVAEMAQRHHSAAPSPSRARLPPLCQRPFQRAPWLSAC